MTNATLSPVRALLLGLPLSLILGGLLSDLAYYRTQEIQWANFAAWLVVGAQLLGAIVLLVALVDLIRARAKRQGLYFLLIAAMWGVGMVNTLVHARDGWASMPAGLYLSIAATLLGLTAAVVGLAAPRRGAVA